MAPGFRQDDIELLFELSAKQPCKRQPPANLRLPAVVH